MLPSTKGFDAPSSNYLEEQLFYLTNRIVAGLLQLIKTITHAWSVSAPSQSALFKPKMFSNCIVVQVDIIVSKNQVLQI